MSYRITSAMLKVSGFTSTEKFILTVLADFSDEYGGKIYPAIATICERTGYGERTVQTVLKSLAERGFIAVTYGGGRATNGVILNLEKLGITPATGAPEPRNRNGAPPQQVRGTPAPVAPENIIEQTKEQTKEQGRVQILQFAPPAPVELLDFAAPDQTPAITPEKPKRERKTREPFRAPTLEEVTEHWQAMEYPGGADEAEHFFDKHTAKGWRIGSSPMKDWKAACRTWVRYVKQNRFGAPNGNTPKNFNRRPQRGGNLSAEDFARTAARHGAQFG